jgi:L-cysteate sulfo-lyase
MRSDHIRCPSPEFFAASPPVGRADSYAASSWHRGFLGSSSNGVGTYAKRDDLVSLGGGNRLRKLEFLLGAAAAAAKLGLACELVLARMVPRGGDEYDRNGNVLLDDLFGAGVHNLPTGVNSAHFTQRPADDLRVAGHIAYVVSILQN